MGANYLYASAAATAASLAGLQWWAASLLDGIRSDGLIEGSEINAGNAGRALELVMASRVTLALLANLAVNALVLVLLCLKTLFFVQLYPSETRKLLERLVNYVIYRVHTKRRNRLTTSKLNELVYIMYNKRLKDRHLKLKTLKEDEDPLVVEDVPSDDEWIVDGAQDKDASRANDEEFVANFFEETQGSGSAQGPNIRGPQVYKRKRGAHGETNIRGKGKKQLLVTDEEPEWEDVDPSDGEDEQPIRYNDDSLEDPSSDSGHDEE